ncbi:thiamine pyrophosphokinase [Pedobacter sp. SYSU D00535]|uniref:thiamine pyrophosphokinase n=1 Tax=Pedobacter sp. SYSU D00535 TaxID=2810308 RepID=UPI001A96B59A|nr:thiamine pyrophosphokinase [Pedobacter sp. SYSU D00535]
MSSHHIVREKQEPALLIMDLEGFNYENLGQLLEWSPTVVVDEKVYENVDSLGIKVDAIISKELSPDLQDNTLVIHTVDAPLQDALKFLVGEQYPAVNIITSEFTPKDYLLFVGRINLVVLTPEKKVFPVASGFSKWQAAAERLEVLREAQNLQTTGLRKISDGVFETEKDGFYTLTFDNEFTFISESL